MMKKLLLLVGCLVSFASCKNGPNLTVCIVDALHEDLVCADSRGNQTIIAISEADNYVALSPDDFKRLMDWAKLRCAKP
jgi:hypothetical protein